RATAVARRTSSSPQPGTRVVARSVTTAATWPALRIALPPLTPKKMKNAPHIVIALNGMNNGPQRPTVDQRRERTQSVEIARFDWKHGSRLLVAATVATR